LCTGGAWPDDGEIDIMQQKGFSSADKQQLLANLHTRSGFGDSDPSAVWALPNACNEFNTYT
jgi:hypothetical protein